MIHFLKWSVCIAYGTGHIKEKKKSFLSWWDFRRMKQGQEINIDVRLPCLTDLLCDTICQVVAGPGNSPGIGQHLSGLWPPQSKMENICQYVTFRNKRWSGTFVRTIRILCWGCQMSYNCGTKIWTCSFLGQKCFISSDLFFQTALKFAFAFLPLGLWKFKRFCKRFHLVGWKDY